MKPKKEFIKIGDNRARIQQLLQELVLEPRVKALEWSKITKQTPNMKIGYPGQHLASLITGMEGARTGARGDDLEDGTEIKSCSRVDQLDNCRECGKKVLRIEQNCPHCKSTNINRMNDSKWLFTIKSQDELNLLIHRIDRIFLTLADYPNHEQESFDSLRFQAFEIWNNEKRHKNFSTLMENYYNKIFLTHKGLYPNKTPAPKNFWPYSYQFYLCNPVKVFEAIVEKANTTPIVNIITLVTPYEDRENLIPEKMPTNLLNDEEIKILALEKNREIINLQLLNGKVFEDIKELVSQKRINKVEFNKMLPFINQSARELLPLRDTDKIAVEKIKYQRR